ncbi:MULTISPECIES: N-acetylmuramoyl-L-alanine amidase family protein [Reichenbachiella]|uniref:N-acetylmuramoyl-L-alanine amidase n=1 Tax=Reichenbachiella agariperforans TaxID=156994 RepID=A0A1M6LFB2_REIAG|nr:MULTISPECIES: N-acetylmuramoyl-L-alanine amidase [Reichenbachiella]MBU2913902.1 N-acetylmuramoyl-L-alanine amidase [Reichenbachiella agariperforans]RJE75390.1 N-acetylmuramoyl-L-alanine amidase [Reichenbachiella sp. MSK19-1]SHJ69836.1 N-acetylmuramoyl-L-alanine amidase [Reichenbachiella agariperforans]
MKNILVIVFFALGILFASFNNTGVKDYKVKKIVIDAGHGGKDQGTSGDFSLEKDIALSIALETGKIINEYLPDVEVIYTRADDSFPTLYERADLANNNHADLFISIHCNSAPYSETVHGTETYIMGLHKSDENFEVAMRENSVITMEDNAEAHYEGFDPNSPESYILFSLYQSAYQSNSLELAQNVEDQFKNRVGRRSRGVKSAGFLVLWKTSMPSILIETGFLSNAKEEKDLNDKLQQTYIASGIFRAFRDYKNELESKN